MAFICLSRLNQIPENKESRTRIPANTMKLVIMVVVSALLVRLTILTLIYFLII